MRLGMSFGPDGIDVINYAHQLSNLPTNPYGRTVWWRYKSRSRFGKGQSNDYWYMSVTPGAFRRTPPEGTDAIVKDLPPIDSTWYQDILAELIRQCDELGICSDLVGVANCLLNGQYPKSSQIIISRLNQIYHLDQDDARDQLETELTDLYEIGLFSFGLNLNHFSSAIALLQLFVATGVYVEGEDFRTPHTTLPLCVRAIVESRDTEILTSFKEYVDWTYHNAKNDRAAALNAHSLLSFHRLLYSSVHGFWTVRSLLSGIDSRKLDYDYTAYTAEEHFCNAITSYTSISSFYARSPFALPEEWLTYYHVDHEQYRKRLSERWASILHPVLPQFMFRLLFNYYMLLDLKRRKSHDKEAVEVIRTEFDAIEQSFSGKLGTEAWIDYVILSASKILGHQDEAEKRAYKIAARYIACQHEVKSQNQSASE